MIKVNRQLCSHVSGALAAMLLLVACQQSESYVFRNNDRPTYEDTVDVNKLQAMANAGEVTVLDVRLLEDYEADPTLIPGAVYRNPEEIELWASDLPADKPVVVYCVKGRWVSQKAASYLDNKGKNVFSLEGGIEAWKSAASQ